MDVPDAQAGPGTSRRKRPSGPFISAHHRPSTPDGRYRVILVATGSVASIKIPNIVAALTKEPQIDVQVVATKASLHFYDQSSIDQAVKVIEQGLPNAPKENGGTGGWEGVEEVESGVRVWQDQDEWSDWKQVGEPILHIELRRWADLIVVAPCSADFLAKLAAGFSDNLALSMMRALTPDTPVILCPAMNTHMYQHPLTAEHLAVVQDKLGYKVSGPQGAGTLACGDEGPGKMTDWREIVATIKSLAIEHSRRAAEKR